MLYKVYNINTGKVLKAGFDSEDAALNWLDLQSSLKSQNFAVDEMDPDEEEEWEALSEEEEEAVELDVISDTEDDDTFALNYAQDDIDEGEDADLDLYSEFDPDED